MDAVEGPGASAPDVLSHLDWDAPVRLRLVEALLARRLPLAVLALSLPVAALESGLLVLGVAGYVLGVWLACSSPVPVARALAALRRIMPPDAAWTGAGVAAGMAVLHGFSQMATL